MNQNQSSGISISLYTTAEELKNLKQGASILIGWTEGRQPENAIYRIHVSVDACEILGDQIRVNTTLVQQNIKQLGELIGQAIGNEFSKLVKQLENELQ